MRIAINTRLLLKNRLEGIGWFTFESLRRIVLAHPEHDFYFIFDRPYDEQFVFEKNVTPIVVGPPARHPVLFMWWFELTLPRLLRKIKADAFISPDAYLSINTKIPSLLVIHDLNFEHFPELIPRFARWHYRYFTPRFARRADRIATVSAFSKSDIIKQYGIDPKKIDVVYNGANQQYRPVDEVTKISTKNKITQGDEYFLFIGALNPRKNLANLFKAFDFFKNSHPEVSTKLVVVGEKMYWTDDIRVAYEKMKHKRQVVFTGRLEPDTLVDVMGSAQALAYVSLFEGFGIPIVEAFYAEIPVIAANTTAMPEIAGDAALLVNPLNISEIAHAMETITFDQSVVDQLVQRGKIRKEQFSWDRTATELWQSFEKMIAGTDNNKLH